MEAQGNVEVVKTDSELFDQATIDATMKWVFTPAVMNNAPVAVWVTIPFKFKLQNERGMQIAVRHPRTRQ
jgi:TonB family protein